MYAKHGNLVYADASGAKTSTIYLESRLEVRVTHFGITEKRTRNVGFYRVGNFEGRSISVFENPTVIPCPFLGNPCEYSNKPYVSRN